MSIPKKPIKDVDEFIKTAKVEEKVDDSSPKTESTTKTGGVKKFLIELPYDLWMKLKMRAVQEGKTLKDLILEILENNNK